MDILNLTLDTDIIILVGDTPSYLKPFLETNRKIFNLAISNKPFGCFHPPYSIPIDEPWIKVYVPTKQQLSYYFDYLDTNTMLTREFVKKNWTNIVLVDSSSGQSIQGTSIFLNRYIGNIRDERDIVCHNISGSQPLKFINLSYPYSHLNLDPEIVSKFYSEDKSWFIRNYIPELIICLGSTIFYHKELFMLYDSYPRIVAEYPILFWSPEFQASKLENDFIEGNENILKLRQMLDIYIKTKNDKTFKPNADHITMIKSIEPKCDSSNSNSIKKFLRKINLKMLKMKNEQYFN